MRKRVERNMRMMDDVCVDPTRSQHCVSHKIQTQTTERGQRYQLSPQNNLVTQVNGLADLFSPPKKAPSTIGKVGKVQAGPIEISSLGCGEIVCYGTTIHPKMKKFTVPIAQYETQVYPCLTQLIPTDNSNDVI
eukprot:8378022-Ditylum_brightwellii.AAC.1